MWQGCKRISLLGCVTALWCVSLLWG